MGQNRRQSCSKRASTCLCSDESVISSHRFDRPRLVSGNKHGAFRCPAVRLLLSPCCLACWPRRRTYTDSSRRQPDRQVRVIRRSAACLSVPPIRARLAIPAVSATRRTFHRLGETLQRRSSHQHQQVHHRHAWSHPMRARHSASSAQISFTQESRESTATTPAGRRSASLLGFAEAVNAVDSCRGPAANPISLAGSKQWVENRTHGANDGTFWKTASDTMTGLATSDRVGLLALVRRRRVIWFALKANPATMPSPIMTTRMTTS